MDAPPLLSDLCRVFLSAKALLVTTGELSPRTLSDYRQTAARLLDVFGESMPVDQLGPTEFGAYRADLASRWGPARLGVEVARVRCLFKWGADNGYGLPTYGQAWRVPTRKAVRIDRKARGSRMFDAEEITALLDAAPPRLRAMILLGINGGIGNSDIAKLPVGSIQGDWLDYPRHKTGVDRRIPLWPETIDALRALVPAGAPPEALVFVNRDGRGYDSESRSPIGEAFARLCQRVGVKGRGFYSLRRTFQTVGSETRDEVAVSALMAHVPKADDMSSVYRQRIDDQRLRDVIDHVRAWLFGESGQGREGPAILRMVKEG